MRLQSNDGIYQDAHVQKMGECVMRIQLSGDYPYSCDLQKLPLHTKTRTTVEKYAYLPLPGFRINLDLP